MSIFGKALREYVEFVRVGLILLVVMGLVRFVVGISGVAYDRATNLTSLTILVFLLAILYGQRAAALRFGGYRHLVPVALLLGFAMYGFILLAITVESVGGFRGHFHSPGSGYAPHGMGLYDHIIGQLSVMPTMTAAILGVTAIGYALSRHLAYLKNAFLALTLVAIVRMLAGGLGIPYAIGTWLTSLTVATVALAAYYGYRACVRGLDGYGHAALIAFMIAFAAFHLVVYGFVVSEGLGVVNYFNAAVPEGTTAQQYIESHLRVAPLWVLVLVVVAISGRALGKRRSRE